MGYDPTKFHVIPNGFDVEAFSPQGAQRRQLRQQWGAADDEILFGCVARWDPYKDHENLLQALALCVTCGIHVRCSHSVLMAGSRKDVPAVMNALDVHVLSSVSEAFPNVLAEAMACGTPCISTDVGDAALIVGDTGWVVPPSSPQALSLAIAEAVSSVKTVGFVERKRAARNRIVESFSLEKMRQAYVQLWRSLSHG